MLKVNQLFFKSALSWTDNLCRQNTVRFFSFIHIKRIVPHIVFAYKLRDFRDTTVKTLHEYLPVHISTSFNIQFQILTPDNEEQLPPHISVQVQKDQRHLSGAELDLLLSL